MFIRCLGSTLPILLLISTLYAATTGQSAADQIARDARPRHESFLGNLVDAGTGAFVQEVEILSIQGGRNLDFVLTYNSLLGGRKGPMGFNWSHNYEASIQGSPTGVMTVNWDLNRRNSFQFVSTGAAYAPLDEAVRYDQLLRMTDGSWRLVRLDGTTFEFLASGALRRVGNKVQQFIELDRVNDQLTVLREPLANKRLSLHYAKDGSGLIQSIRDDANRVFYFEYDGAQRLRATRQPVSQGVLYAPPLIASPIPDNNPTGITISFTVTDSKTVGLVEFATASFLHSRPEDLQVKLTSPLGTQLVVQPTGSGVLGDIPDLSGQMYSRFEGESSAGIWRVNIADTRAGETGQLGSLSLRITGRTDPVRYDYDTPGRITRATGPDGQRLFANFYDAEGRVVMQDDGLDTTPLAAFSYQERSDGSVVTTYRDRAGKEWSYEHDSKYHLTRRTDPLGNSQTYQYNAAGDRIRIVDPLQRATLFNYDSNGNLITFIDPALNATTLTYDGNHNVLTIRDALGKASTFEYDSRNNLTRVTDALGNVDTKIYNSNSQLAGNRLHDGAQINYGYTAGMPTSANHPNSGGSLGSSYDAIGQVTQLKDADGFRTNFEYDASGNVLSTIDALGRSIVSTYDRMGRLTAKRDRNGNLTRFIFDNNSNLVESIDSLGQVTRHVYDAEDRVIQTIDPRGNATTTTYDAAGRIVAQTDELGNTVTREYDAAGNEIAAYDPNGIKTFGRSYDGRGFVTSEEDALGFSSSSTVDPVGRLTQFRDALGRTYTSVFDNLDRLIRVTDPQNRTASQQYESDDVITRITNAGGANTEIAYDNTNRIQRISTPGGRNSSYSYNGRDLLTRETTPGRTFNFTYNDVGELIRVNRTGAGVGAPDTVYSYDGNGNLTLVSSGAVPRLTRRYDPLNRLISYVDGSGNAISYAYDAGGNLARLTYPDGRDVRYTYDAANRMTTITDWAGRVTRYVYNVNSRLTGILFPNGTTRAMQYDAAGQVVMRIDRDAAGRAIVDYRYSLDPVGQVTAESSSQNLPSYAPPTLQMTYDADNRLTSLNGQAVTFDTDGNLTRGPVGGTFVNLTYDRSNNLATAGTAAYAYDEEDRLIQFTYNGGITRLVVDPGPELSQVLMKTAPNGSISRYVWGIGLAYEEGDSGIRVYHYDQRGSTAAFTNGSGVVSGRVSYGPFGEISSRAGETDSIFLYNGLFGVVTDPQGLVNMRFRWYSPDIRRFLNEDSQFGEIGRPLSLNRFLFADNGPILRVDPKGEFWHILAGAVVGATVGVVSQGISDLVHGRKFDLKAAAAAAIGGAVQGAIIAACPACGIAAGVAGSSIGYLTERGLKGEKVDPGELALQSALGGVTGSAKVKIPANRRFAAGFAGATAAQFKRQLLMRQIKNAAIQAAKASIKKGIGKIAIEEGRTLLAPKDSPEPPERAPALGRQDILQDGRSSINRGNKSVFGEYIHWNLYLDALRQAARPLPNNPNNLLTSF